MSEYLRFPKPILDRDEDLIHNHTQDTLERYFVHGLPPGSFVEAVLVGDLYRAVARADAWNKKKLSAIVQWIAYNAPDGSYGSWEAVEAWLADSDGRRTRWLATREKEMAWETLKDTTDKDLLF